MKRWATDVSGALTETLQIGTIVFIAGEPWELLADVPARLIQPFRCPHCGGTTGSWFDRSFVVDAAGNELEPMCYRCSDCGKRLP